LSRKCRSLTLQGYDNPQYAALEIDYSDADEDATGEAFRNAQKVSREEKLG